MIITSNQVIKVYEIQYFIYGNYRQVERPGLGVGIRKIVRQGCRLFHQNLNFFGTNTGPRA